MKDGETVERCIAYAAPTKTKPSGHRVRKQDMIDPRTGETKSRKPTFRGPNSLEEARAYRAGIELALKTGENLEQYLGPIDKNEIVRVEKRSVPERPVVWKATDDTQAPLSIREFVEQHELARIDEFNSPGDHGQKLAAAKFYLPIFGNRYIDDIKPHEIDEFAYQLQRQRKVPTAFARSAAVSTGPRAHPRVAGDPHGPGLCRRRTDIYKTRRLADQGPHAS